MPDGARPNILLITTDQQRFDTLRPWAPSFLRTPHLDHLGREGITFTRAYADNPLCAPSRVSIMTGRTVFGHGMLANGSTTAVMGREETLPGLLRRQGYQTAAIGKMHFTPQRARHGFDEMLLPQDYYSDVQRHGGLLQPMRHGLGQNEMYPSMATVPEALTLTSWIAERCVDYIRDRRDPTVPFLLWVSFPKPHPPLDPPEPYYSMYRDSAIPEPVLGEWSDDQNCPATVQRLRERASSDLLSAEVIRAARAAYYGLVTQVDYALGRVFAALHDVGLFDDTLMLFTSDHGDFLGDHRLIGKTLFHEASARLPMILRLPKNWADRNAGSTVDDLVIHADILPTLVTAAGGVPPSECEGRDLIAVARGHDPRPRRFVEATSSGIYADTKEPLYFGLTDGRWKYIWYLEGGHEQLFDLSSDPTELYDLAGDPAHRNETDRLHAELVDRHRRRGTQQWLSGDQLTSTPVGDDTAAERRNLSWPGYHTEWFDQDIRH